MSKFIDSVIAAAKANRQRIVLPEGHDPRTVEAARFVVEQGIADVVVLGDPASIDVAGGDRRGPPHLPRPRPLRPGARPPARE